MGEGMERQVIAKLRKRLLPLLMLLYIVAYLDRVNIGFAALSMNADIGLSDAAVGLGAGIFFLGYFLFEVPSNLILYRVGARRWIARIMVSWGIVSAAMALVQGPVSLGVLRFLLGVAEAGFFPGVILYISQWFPPRHRAGVIALFMAAAPLATAIGSPLSGALLLLDGLGGWHGWQWLFVIEAVPAIALGWVVWRSMPDRPEEAGFLSPEEQAWLTAELARSAAKPAEDHSLAALKVLFDPRVLLLGLVYFGSSAGLYVMGIWSPRLIAVYTHGPFATGLASALPPIVSVFAMIVWSRRSDRTGERVWHVIAPSLLAAIGLALAAGAKGLIAVIAALTLVNIGISAAKPPLWTIPPRFLGGAQAAAGIAAVNSIGNLGGFFGSTLIGWVKTATGSFSGGLYVMAVLVALSCLPLLAIRPSLKSPE